MSRFLLAHGPPAREHKANLFLSFFPYYFLSLLSHLTSHSPDFASSESLRNVFHQDYKHTIHPVLNSAWVSGRWRSDSLCSNRSNRSNRSSHTLIWHRNQSPTQPREVAAPVMPRYNISFEQKPMTCRICVHFPYHLSSDLVAEDSSRSIPTIRYQRLSGLVTNHRPKS